MFETANQDLYIKKGETWNPPFTFSIDLTGWKVRIVIGLPTYEQIVLDEGSGITVTTGASSTAQPLLTPEQTSSFEHDQHWYMQLTDPDGKVGFPMSGTMHFLYP